MSVTEREVETTVLALKALGYARVVYPGSGERVTKYRHVADEVLGLDDAMPALLGLLFRAARRRRRSCGRVRSACTRSPPSGDVEEVLRSMAQHDPPLVQHYERLRGEREGRWRQLVAEEAVPLEARAATSGSAAIPRTDRMAELEARVAALEARLAKLEALLE